MPVFGAHILHETTAPSEHRDYGAACFLRGIDDHMFDGFVPLSINLAEDDFRTGNLKLESFAAHRFDKHGKMEFSAAGDFVAVRARDQFHMQSHVHFTLTLEARADVAGGEGRSLFSREG